MSTITIQNQQNENSGFQPHARKFIANEQGASLSYGVIVWTWQFVDGTYGAMVKHAGINQPACYAGDYGKTYSNRESAIKAVLRQVARKWARLDAIRNQTPIGLHTTLTAYKAAREAAREAANQAAFEKSIVVDDVSPIDQSNPDWIVEIDDCLDYCTW